MEFYEEKERNKHSFSPKVRPLLESTIVVKEVSTFSPPPPSDEQDRGEQEKERDWNFAPGPEYHQQWRRTQGEKIISAFLLFPCSRSLPLTSLFNCYVYQISALKSRFYLIRRKDRQTIDHIVIIAKLRVWLNNQTDPRTKVINQFIMYCNLSTHWPIPLLNYIFTYCKAEPLYLRES